MSEIRPISELRNKTGKISELAQKTDGVIFITKNGEGNMVVMSLTRYEEFLLKVDRLSKLATAQAQRARREKGRTLADVMKDLRKRIHEQT